MELIETKKIVEKGLDFSARIIDSIKSKIKVLCISLLLTGNAPAADSFSARNIPTHVEAPSLLKFKIMDMGEIKYFYELFLFLLVLAIGVIGYERLQAGKVERIMTGFAKRPRA